MPEIKANPIEWLSFADSDNNNELDEQEVVEILQAVTTLNLDMIQQVREQVV